MKNERRVINDINSLIQTIAELGIPFEKMCEEHCGVEWDRNARSFDEMMMDDLDVISVILEIEKKFDIDITDVLLEELVISTKPNDLVVASNRNSRLDELGI